MTFWELLLKDGSPLTSKRVWALNILCFTVFCLCAVGVPLDDVRLLLEDLAPIALALVVGESLKDSVTEIRRMGGTSRPAVSSAQAPQ